MGSALQAYSLQAAAPEHAATIKRLVRAAHLNPLGLHWSRFTVALSAAGEVVGCIQIKSHKDGSRELASLLVIRSWRGQGVGAALVRRAKESGPPPLWLMCRAALMPFYRQYGFVQVQDAGRMAPYFRRVFRLFRLLRLFVSKEDRLTIMRWPTADA